VKSIYEQLPVVNIKQGEVYIAHSPSLISTVLGSCISVTLFNRRLRVGAMCHGFMPRWKQGSALSKRRRNKLMFVDYSIEKMLEEFYQLGISGNDIEVKMFGGAKMLMPHETSTVNMSIAQENIDAARDAIQAAGLKLLTYDVGGQWGRKLIFNTDTGEVLLKRIKKSA